MEDFPAVQRTHRQLNEIHLALFYKQVLGGYGTDGHHRLMLIADDAEKQGYHFGTDSSDLRIPPHVEVVAEERRK